MKFAALLFLALVVCVLGHTVDARVVLADDSPIRPVKVAPVAAVDPVPSSVDDEALFRADAAASAEDVEELLRELGALLDQDEVAPVSYDDPIPVPYTNCGQPTDIVVLESITSTVWPPAPGLTAALSINFNVTAEVQDGTYTAYVSVDGIVIIDKTGDISKYFKVPIQPGPVTINKNITLPNPLPFSGTIGLQLSAVDTNQNELFCLQLTANV